jgi:hypothetical protein
MINLKSLITESTKNIKILVKGKRGDIDQYVSFTVFVQSGVFVLLPKTSKDLDKLDLVNHDDAVDSMIKYLKKNTKIDFQWSLHYNSVGAGYGFEIDYNKLLNQLK